MQKKVYKINGTSSSFMVLKIMAKFKVYESRYIAHLETSGNKPEKTK